MHDIFVEVFEGISREEQLELAKQIGFKGFFSGPECAHDTEELTKFHREGKRLGLIYETIHSTIPGCSDIWFEGQAGDTYIDLLLRETDSCAALGVPILIVHVQTDFRKDTIFELGVARYNRLITTAKQKGIKIAFENADNEAYLYRVLAHFDEANVGFCYDSGHEEAITPGAQFLPKLGHRLLCTHLHDNDGKKDLHLLPFDGVIDFERIAKQFKMANYKGNLTFELRYNEAYASKMSKKEFLETCYARALKIREMSL